MKTLLRLLLAAGVFTFTVPALTSSFAAEKAEKKEKKEGKEEKDEKDEKEAPKGSIRPTGELTTAQMAKLAKVSFSDALKAALAAAPGVVAKAELEVEDGNLQFSFEIVGADGKTTEVEIDAGNGKVLDVDKG